MKSDLLIISNDVYFKQQPSGSVIETIMPEAFPGTQVVIHLNTKHLRPLETEAVVNDEFSF
jgi:hypothetical protein